MYKAIEIVRNLVKTKNFTTTDVNFVINTKFTPFLLIFFSILLTTKDVLRTSIDCFTDMSGNKLKSMMDNYCWSVGTYICKDEMNSELILRIQ